MGELIDTPIVSVVIACYNHGKYVQGAIESVMAQTFTDFELIITDDGSTDDSREIIRQTVEAYHDPRIRCDLREKNTAFACLEEAYRSAQGKYVAGMGGDDRMKPDKLRKQVEVLDNSENQYVACFTWIEAACDNAEVGAGYEQLFNISISGRENILRELISSNFINAPSMMVRRDIFSELGGYDFTLRQLQDYELWLKILLQHDIYILPEKLTVYGVVSGSVSEPNADTTVRTAEELSIVLFAIMNGMKDDLFDRVFMDQDPTHHSHLDILCRKVTLLMDKKRNVAARNAGIRLYYQYRTEPGFIRKMTESYAFSRLYMQRLLAQESPYQAMLREEQHAQQMREMGEEHRFREKYVGVNNVDMVNQLLDYIDSSEESKEVTLDHICALYDLCGKMEGGEEYFEGLIHALREKGVPLFAQALAQ